ncbi:10827_t:CDS:2, partial [Acaulospora colombiana]
EEVVNGLGLKIDDICDAEIYNLINKIDVLGIIRGIEISVMSQDPKWKQIKENAMKVYFSNNTLTLLDGTNISVIKTRTPPPTQLNQSTNDYFEEIKVYATTLNVDLDNQNLKETFFNGLLQENKKE